MKKTIALLAVAAALIPAAAVAEQGQLTPYLSGKLGFIYSVPETFRNLDLIGGSAAVAIGVNYQHHLDFNIRQEIEAGYAVAGGNHSSVQTLSGMANMYFDFGHHRLRPYVGAGLGISEVYMNPKNVTAYSSFGLNWGLYAGLNYTLGRYWIADLGLKYTEAETKAIDVPTWGITLGARTRF